MKWKIVNTEEEQVNMSFEDMQDGQWFYFEKYLCCKVGKVNYLRYDLDSEDVKVVLIDAMSLYNNLFCAEVTIDHQHETNIKF
jgi:hypothetical protein